MNKQMLLAGLILLQSCAAVNVRTDDQPEDLSTPTFQKTYTYWWFGLQGEHRINVREVCMGKPVKQMQTVDSATDSLMRLITLGIYWPRTARVWCAGDES